MTVRDVARTKPATTATASRLAMSNSKWLVISDLYNPQPCVILPNTLKGSVEMFRVVSNTGKSIAITIAILDGKNIAILIAILFLQRSILQ